VSIDDPTPTELASPDPPIEPPVDERFPAAPNSPTSVRRVAILTAVAAFVLLADEITKSIVAAHLTPGSSPRILGGLFYFSLVRNSGAAWGVAGGATALFAVISAAVAATIIRMARRLRSTVWAVALGLLLGGALGNLSDRLFRAPGFLRGRVVDFISVLGPDGQHFPVFNIADSAVTTGVALLFISMLLGIGLEGKPGNDRQQ